MSLDQIAAALNAGNTTEGRELAAQALQAHRGFMTGFVQRKYDLDYIDADEIVQQYVVGLVVRGGFWTYDAQRGQFTAWWKTGLSNKATDFFREQVRRKRAVDKVYALPKLSHDNTSNDFDVMCTLTFAAPEPAPEEIVLEDELMQVVRAAVGQLGQKQRIIAEGMLDGESCRELSNSLNIPVGTVKRTHYDAKKKLREMLVKYVV